MIISQTNYTYSATYLTAISPTTNFNTSSLLSYVNTVSYTLGGGTTTVDIPSIFQYYTNGGIIYYDPINPSKYKFSSFTDNTYTLNDFTISQTSTGYTFVSNKGFYTFQNSSQTPSVSVPYSTTTYQYTYGSSSGKVDLIYSDGHSQITTTVDIGTFNPNGGVTSLYTDALGTSVSFTMDSSHPTSISPSDLKIRCVPSYSYSGSYNGYPIVEICQAPSVTITDPYSRASVTGTFSSNIGTTFSNIKYTLNSVQYILYNATSSTTTFPTIYGNPTDSTSFSFTQDTTTNYDSLIAALSSNTSSAIIQNFMKTLTGLTNVKSISFVSNTISL